VIPKTVRRKHVLAALLRIDEGEVPSGRESRGYDLVHDGKRYPPKYALTLAIEETEGKRPSPDDLGGGEETNSFLRGLGFTIVAKGAAGAPPSRAPSPAKPAPKPAAKPPVVAPPSGTTVRVGRVFLNIGVRMTEGKHGDFEQLTRAQFTPDPGSYRDRLVRLIERAREAGADVVVLPAGAFILSKKAMSLSAYAVPDVPMVVAGGSDDNGEFAVVMRHGVAGERFDAQRVHWLDAGRFTVLTAISSTIGKLIRDERRVEPIPSKLAPPDPNKPILLLDVGHNQYGARYHFNTLRCVARDAPPSGQPAALVLSSWMWSSKGIACSWCQPEDRVTVRTLTAPEERDRLDLIDVDLSAAGRGGASGGNT
jgi:hypothetical protein